jgi:hypothetical protein
MHSALATITICPGELQVREGEESPMIFYYGGKGKGKEQTPNSFDPQ